MYKINNYYTIMISNYKIYSFLTTRNTRYATCSAVLETTVWENWILAGVISTINVPFLCYQMTHSLIF